MAHPAEHISCRNSSPSHLSRAQRHCPCCVLYFLWWDKPFDIRDPFVISGPWRRPAVAVMWMFTLGGKRMPTLQSTTHPPTIESLIPIEKVPWGQICHEANCQREHCHRDGAQLPKATAPIPFLPFRLRTLLHWPWRFRSL